MSLIVQDNTGEIADANGYISAAFFITYHSDRGVADVVDGNIDAGDIESAIVRATTYVDSRFRRRFKGCKWKDPSLQTTEFPRINICDDGGFDISETIPISLQQAIAEYALVAVDEALTVQPVANESGQVVKRSKEKVDVIEEEIEFHEGGGVGPIRQLPKADFLLRELLHNSNRVERA
jgi:hypothetical protein